MVQSISFVLPAFNEECNIERAVAACVAAAVERKIPFEVIPVDDGSTDRTRSILHRLARDDARIRPVFLDRNRGYGGALKSGLFAANREWIFFTDADL